MDAWSRAEGTFGPLSYQERVRHFSLERKHRDEK